MFSTRLIQTFEHFKNIYKNWRKFHKFLFCSFSEKTVSI